MPTGIRVDLKQIAQWKDAQMKHFQELTQNWDTHFETYEKKVREAVHHLDLKSREARKASESRLKEVSSQIQKTRGDVERRVKGLLDDEAKKLNVRLREIYSYLVKVAQKDQAAAKKASAKGAAKKSGAKTKAKSAGAKARPAKNGSPRKTRAKSVVADAAPSLEHQHIIEPTSIN